MLAAVAFLLVGLVILVQYLGVSRYLRWFRNYELPRVNDLTLPKAAIVLSIRGAGPSLQECLTRLGQQDYPKYEIHIVVDHRSDPANRIIEHWLESRPTPTVSVSYLQNPSAKAYLKTSAVLQAITALSEDVEVAAIADSDTLAYPRWLEDLVTPLLVRDVGLVTGNRWYNPTSRSAGMLCRFFYNAICVAPMYFMRATWGGSLSIKREVFDNQFFRQKMTNTPCEDAAMQAAARNGNRGLEVQPNVIMFSDEHCSLLGAFDFIKRQLLWTRLYHPAWHLLLAGTWGLHLLLAGLLLGGIYFLATGRMITGLALLAAIFALIVASLYFVEQLHRSISDRVEREQGFVIPAIDWLARLRMFVCLPLAFFMMCYAMLAAALSRSVSWSGVKYKIVPAGPTRKIPPGGLRMEKYMPIQEVIANSRATVDIEIDPLIEPLRSNSFLIDLICQISGKDRDEVSRRFKQEHGDLGGNVRRALSAAGIEPHVYSPQLEKFYTETDAFLYETLVWNRTSLKNDMRKWIGRSLAKRSTEPLRVLSFGDGLGIDAYYLSQLGHDVTYFDVSVRCTNFARQLFKRGNLEVTMLNSPQQLLPQYFDAIVCLDVLEHVPRPSELVAWLTGALRVGGELFVHAPFHYLHPAVQTHLRSNRQYSGDVKALYQQHGLHPIDGQIFLNPLVLRKIDKSAASAPSLPWRIHVGSTLMKTGRFWSWPHIAVGKMLIGKRRLIAMAEANS